ncbi:MAG: adenylyl-sulfate kinase [Aquabacterium sp.]|uniref:bifunctional aminoglycoside phosphotransferase/ATP-binding protein n=1 Tax=Aquabacterium sp. TaxID=1872578 RepID=UPI0012245382|nr:bifunctional aminoglycoside phosphotransferase/ATP-binding protein [Aquabacterium sp.]TAK86583.1 MAG: adenylyl-sulfate kinase [Aquabacterium sp.]
MSLELVRTLQKQWHAQLVETHISWVLLDGQFAWKIKKPVHLSFLDFSALRTRQRLSEVELQLNRRLAPDLYLAVQAITGSPAAPVLNGPGQPFEYVLQMKQFAPGALLSERLAAHTLMAEHLDTLARRLAAFHEVAAVAGPDTDWGSPERISHPVDVLLTGLAEHGCQEACTRLRPWLHNEARRLQSLWHQRKAQGRVVEGHGDLHLANAVMLGEDVTAFDCIEFDPALRWIDGLSDMAFLAMDLMAHGRADLAWRFINTYLDTRGDHAGLPVLRYYLVYRALVRALVTRLRGDQRRESDQGPDYLALALQLIEPVPPGQPALLITHGLSGSGKSHVSAAMLMSAGAVRLRADVIRRQLLGPGHYDQAATQATYARLHELAALALSCGYLVIVDATFLDATERTRFRQMARDRGAPFAILHCHAPVSILQERVQRRQAQGDDPSEADLVVLARQVEGGDALLAEEASNVLDVDASQPWSAVDLTRRWLSMPPPQQAH